MGEMLDVVTIGTEQMTVARIEDRACRPQLLTCRSADFDP